MCKRVSVICKYNIKICVHLILDLLDEKDFLEIFKKCFLQVFLVYGIQNGIEQCIGSYGYDVLQIAKRQKKSFKFKFQIVSHDA